MKTYPPAQTLAFFEVEPRVQWLEAKGNTLSRWDAVIDWEGFRYEQIVRLKLRPFRSCGTA